MSRNIKINFKHLNTNITKMLTKNTNDSQMDSDFELSSFQSNNNLYRNSYTNATTDSSNMKNKFNTKSYIPSKNNSSILGISIFKNTNHNKSKSRSKYLQHNTMNYLLQNNSISKENNTFNHPSKKPFKTNLKPKNQNCSSINIKQKSPFTKHQDFGILNISIKNSKSKQKCEKAPEKQKFRKNSMGGINIKNIKKISPYKKINNPNVLNKVTMKTNINSPLDSNRKKEKIIELNNKLLNKNNEIIEWKNKINEQDNYIFNLEQKIKNLQSHSNNYTEDEYEQYSKKTILRNIRMLTTENEELTKQIKEYKAKEFKIMKLLYAINKKGISMDTILACANDNDNKGQEERQVNIMKQKLCDS